MYLATAPLGHHERADCTGTRSGSRVVCPFSGIERIDARAEREVHPSEMGRRPGLGRYAEKKRRPDSKPGSQDSKKVASRNDTAVDNRTADLLIGLGYPHLTDAPAESAIDESVIFESVLETPAQPGSPAQPSDYKKLLGKRLDVCCSYQLDEGGSELRWCQGLVVLVSDGHNIKKGPRSWWGAGKVVMICWDADEARKEASTTSEQELAPSKWNPKGVHVAGAWRFDIQLAKAS